MNINEQIAELERKREQLSRTAAYLDIRQHTIKILINSVK